jgi:hypothetical protein
MEWLVVLAVAAAFGTGYWFGTRRVIGDEQWSHTSKQQHHE